MMSPTQGPQARPGRSPGRSIAGWAAALPPKTQPCPRRVGACRGTGSSDDGVRLGCDASARPGEVSREPRPERLLPAHARDGARAHREPWAERRRASEERQRGTQRAEETARRGKSTMRGQDTFGDMGSGGERLGVGTGQARAKGARVCSRLET